MLPTNRRVNCQPYLKMLVCIGVLWVLIILRRNVGYSHILFEHYCTHILSPATRAASSGITKRSYIFAQAWVSMVWVAFQHLAYQITLPHPYIQYKKMPWQLAMNVGVGGMYCSCSIANCVQISQQKKHKCALNSKVRTCSHCWHVPSICCTRHLATKNPSCSYS